MNKFIIISPLIISYNANSQDCKKFTGEYIGQESFIFIDGPMTGYADTIESNFTIEFKGSDTLVLNNFGWLYGVIGICKSDSIIIPIQQLGTPEDGATFSISGKGRLYNDTLIYEYYEGGALIEGLYRCNGFGVNKVNTQSVLQIETEFLRFFPNPANNKITISNPSNIKIKKLELFDSSGRVVQLWESHELEGTQLNIQHILPGIYLLKAETNAGIKTEKLVVR